MPNEQYRTILADPPWDIQQKGHLGAQRHYPLMSIEAICALRVDKLADPDAHLWLWVTNATIHPGKSVMEAWGSPTGRA